MASALLKVYDETHSIDFLIGILIAYLRHILIHLRISTRVFSFELVGQNLILHQRSINEKISAILFAY